MVSKTFRETMDGVAIGLEYPPVSLSKVEQRNGGGPLQNLTFTQHVQTPSNLSKPHIEAAISAAKEC